MQQAVAARDRVQHHGALQPALHALLEIYVREREWTRAIDTATELERLSGVPFRQEIAQYYCELAMNEIIVQNPDAARNQLPESVGGNVVVVGTASLAIFHAFQGESALAANSWAGVGSRAGGL